MAYVGVRPFTTALLSWTPIFSLAGTILAIGVAVIIVLDDFGTCGELILVTIREGRRAVLFPAVLSLFKELRQLKDKVVKGTSASNSC